jgi:hypothetical protein
MICVQVFFYLCCVRVFVKLHSTGVCVMAVDAKCVRRRIVVTNGGIDTSTAHHNDVHHLVTYQQINTPNTARHQHRETPTPSDTNTVRHQHRETPTHHSISGQHISTLPINTSTDRCISTPALQLQQLHHHINTIVVSMSSTLQQNYINSSTQQRINPRNKSRHQHFNKSTQLSALAVSPLLAL